MIVSLSLTYVLSAGLDGSGPAMRTLSVPFHESSSREADSPRCSGPALTFRLQLTGWAPASGIPSVR
eukprot:scaffold51_cov401-Prasinococcus_capsulatus_cf.AAC.30